MEVVGEVSGSDPSLLSLYPTHSSLFQPNLPAHSESAIMQIGMLVKVLSTHQQNELTNS